MKQLLSILLLVLVLTLCACGAEDSTITPATTEPTFSPDLEEIMPIAPVTEYTQTEEYRTELLLGQWIPGYPSEGFPQELFFREDKTCTIDGIAYTWEFTYDNGHNFGLEVYEADTPVYKISMFGGEKEYVVEIFDESDTRCAYINPAHYDIIEITPDNWLDYFEIEQGYDWSENAFGEVNALYTSNYWVCLKEEYIDRLSDTVTQGEVLSKNAMEISFSYGYQECQIDVQAQTCTPIEGTTTFAGTDTWMGNLYHHSLLNIYDALITAGPAFPSGSSVPVKYDFQLIRANCPLYLIKDEYAIKD